MPNINKISFLIGALMLTGAAYAQDPINADRASGAASGEPVGVNKSWKPSLVRDGVIDRVEHVNKASEWQNIREVDVAWYQRVWRQIDVRQKQNQAFLYEGDEYTGGGAFIEILIDAVKKGKIAAYSPVDDRFTTPLDKATFERATGGGIDTGYVIDPITQEQTVVYKEREFNINSVTKYRVKEDWVFDRNLGRRVVRIVGIAPLIDRTDDEGNYRNSVEMFWIWYPEARNVLATYEVYNPQNMIRRMSWSDYLDGGYFASTIVKYSKNNVNGTDFKSGFEGLESGERVMEDLINQEIDMWEQ